MIINTFFNKKIPIRRIRLLSIVVVYSARDRHRDTCRVNRKRYHYRPSDRAFSRGQFVLLAMYNNNNNKHIQSDAHGLKHKFVKKRLEHLQICKVGNETSTKNCSS